MSTVEAKPKRRRCDGDCGELKNPDELVPVGPKRKLCQECLVAEAAEMAGVEPAPLPGREHVFANLPDEPAEGWPARHGRMSPSNIALFLTCPEQWRRQRILGERTPSNGSLIAGSAAHETAEAFFLHKLATDGELLDPLTVKATARAAFDVVVETEMAKGGWIDWKGDMTLEASREAAEFAARCYLDEAGARVDPVALEYVTTTRVAGVPVPIVYVTDVLTEDAIIDLKFGGKSVRDIQSYWIVQGLVQQIAQRRACEWHSISWAGKVNAPWSAPGLRVERTPERYTIAVELVRHMYRSMMAMLVEFGRNRPWPGTVGSNACSMCDYRRDCSWWTGQPWLDAADVLG